jgi:class 3 adenylate cyclase/predicted ATPase/DNA polymerase III delta prime subunit
MQQVADWLEKLGMSEYAQRFAENGISIAALRHLTDQDLREIHVLLGHRRIMLAAIGELARAAEPVAPIAGSEARPRDSAERRQVTVMFCDLVGSTALSARMDPEDLREIVSGYQRCVTETVRRFGGFVAKYMGDGVLVYFGYPTAHEDDADRAVRAGLAVVEAVGRLPTEDEPLQVRIGIATGLVVVGDLVGAGAAQEQAVVGETPNLAARLQALAPPNAVVIAQGTHRLTGGLFEYQCLGRVEAKGFAESVRAWRVLEESQVENRFEALHPSVGETPLVGREGEIELLLQWWQRAKSGEGHVVLLSGEPGIGKSRITAALQQRLAGEPFACLRYFCSPYYQDSALRPTIAQLERAAGFAREDAPKVKLTKLEALLAPTRPSDEDVALLAELLSIPVTTTAGRYPVLNLTPQRKKERTFKALLRQLAMLARQRPVLMVFEDAHWVDPTSMEQLDRVVEQVRCSAVLLLITFRPEFSPPWTSQGHVTTLTLDRLDQRESAALAQRIAGSYGALPAEALDEIVARTDGVPLFVEELTKAVIEASAGAELVLSGTPAAARAVPSTLHASLIARLDRLGPAAKEVAQVGAAIGREFSYQLLAAVAAPRAEVQDVLSRLVDAGLLFQRGSPPEASYIFKHALVQDVAYSTLLRKQRRQLHRNIAQRLEQHDPAVAQGQPELLAYHCSEAGLHKSAIAYWTAAGERAVRRAANTEAVRHFRRVLALLGAEPDTPERSATELKILAELGPAMMSTQGWTVPEVERVYDRALQLARATDSSADLVAPLVGLWLFHNARGEFGKARESIQELFRVAHTLNDPNLLLQAHHAAWPTPMFCGDFTAAYQHVEQGLSLYDEREHRHHAFQYMGHDPAVCAHALGAIIAWVLGYPERAARHADSAVQFARQLEHAPTLAHALWFVCTYHILRDDVEAALAASSETLALCEEHRLAQPKAAGMLYRGWALVRSGKIEEGLTIAQNGLAAWEQGGAGAFLQQGRFVLAETYSVAGRPDEAMKLLDAALAHGNKTGEKWCEARIHHLRAQLSIASEKWAQAERCLRTALEVAHQQDACSFELRSAARLAGLWRNQGLNRQAYELLALSYGKFKEGFDTPDLRQAKALLDELHSLSRRCT